MKKLLALTLVLLLSLSAFAGCGQSSSGTPSTSGESTPAGGAPSDTPATGDQTTITFTVWDETQMPATQAMVAGFHDLNPDINVELTAIPYDQYITKMQTSLSTGTASDVFWLSTALATQYVPMGVIEPLTPYAERDGYDLSVLNANILDSYTYDGQLYAIPKDIDCFVMFYNKALFDAAGVDYPTDDWTWDDLREIAARLTIEGQQYGFCHDTNDRAVYGTMMSFGGKIYSDDRMTSVVNSPENIQALQMLSDMMYVDKIAPQGAEIIEQTSQTLFLNGITAIDLDGSWRLAINVEAHGDNLGIVEVPTGPAGKVTTSHGIGYGTSATGSNKEAAWRLLQYLGSADAQEKQVSVVIPANNDVASSWEAQYTNHDVSPIVRSMGYSPTNPLALQNTNAAREAFRGAIQEIWLNTGDVATILANVEDRMNEEINR